MFWNLVHAAAAQIPVLSITKQDLLATLEPWDELLSTQVGWLSCSTGVMEEMPCLPLLRS